MLRELGHVVGVDQVVRESRVPGLPAERRLEDRVGAFLVGERRIRGARLPHRDEGERVEDRRLRVLRAVAPHGVHGQRVAEQPRRGIRAVVIGVVGADRAKIVALARRPGRGEAALDRADRDPCVRGGWRGPQRVQQAHRLPPPGHGAARIRRDRPVEGLRRLLVPEGMQIGDAALDAAASSAVAGRWKLDAAQLLRVTAVLLGLLCGQWRAANQRERCKALNDANHRAPPFRRHLDTHLSKERTPRVSAAVGRHAFHKRSNCGRCAVPSRRTRPLQYRVQATGEPWQDVCPVELPCFIDDRFAAIMPETPGPDAVRDRWPRLPGCRPRASRPPLPGFRRAGRGVRALRPRGPARALGSRASGRRERARRE